MAIAPAPIAPDADGRNQRLGIALICAVSLIFAAQDAVGRHLGTLYPPVFVTMIRYWVFAAFAVLMAARGPGGLRAAVNSRHKVAQSLRGLLLAAEIVLMLVSFVKLGIIETHAVFTVTPLMVVALSGPVLGEHVGWRRWLAVGVGFLGMLIILQPGFRVISPWAALPLMSALMFAVYGLLTRQVSADDGPLVSFFWTGMTGVVAITLAGIWYAVPVAPADWPWMAALYALAEASSLQSFAYTQLVWVSLIGFFLLGERVAPNVILGMVIIVGAGLFTWWRAMQRVQTTRHNPRG